MSHLVLEYLRVFFSAPVMAAFVALVFLVTFREDLKALFLRIAKIRFPGGAEVSTSQAERQEVSAVSKPAPVSPASGGTAQLPPHLTAEQEQQVNALLVAEQATSRLWEYRFLNYFLVPHTQGVLDWLARSSQQLSYSFYDTQWLPVIPSANERSAIINALQAHHLVQVTGQSLSVTPKGYEYLSWRGPLQGTS